MENLSLAFQLIVALSVLFVWIFRYDNGNKMIERIYREGSLLEKKCWEESGNECECGQYWWDGCK